ncbi:hypothetical protein [Sphingomonas sp. MS122]|uniref:hypothetical protein n=1 Tax=Sphingomonas sp. MS122 TaxID=3412683 RepID=UPI003C2F8848
MAAKLIRSCALMAALALAGCTPIDTGFGESVRANQALHVINPGPVADDVPIAASGERAAAAAERYRKGEVKPPATVTTTGSASASGGPPK